MSISHTRSGAALYERDAITRFMFSEGVSGFRDLLFAFCLQAKPGKIVDTLEQLTLRHFLESFSFNEPVEPDHKKNTN
jgi:hypothetical protein